MTAGKEKRLFFPRGLHQPRSGFRFSIDALLLACFVSPKKGFHVLELGTGCGVVGLGMLLRNPNLDFQIIGIDKNRTILALAEKNISAMGFQDRFSVTVQDLKQIRADQRFGPETFDLVISNPPYRTPKQGRTPPGRYTKSAKIEQDACLTDFLNAAAYVLKNKGILNMIYTAERLAELLVKLCLSSLEPKRLQLVHAYQDRPAKLVLVEARKNGHRGLEVCPPLFLYEHDQEGHFIAQSALDFCPFLQCNRLRAKGQKG